MPRNEHEILPRFAPESARPAIVGLGYVGLPLAQAAVDAGFPVLGFDTDPKKIDALLRVSSYIRSVSSDQIASMIDRKFEPCAEPKSLAECDAVIICVPTPLREREQWLPICV